MSVKQLIRKNILAMQPYQHKMLAEDTDRLHANEMPWDPLSGYGWQLNCYPRTSQQLTEALSQCYQVNANRLKLTRGSDDGIDALIRLFIEAGQDEMIVCPPTFSMYRINGQIQGATIIESPLNELNFSLDVDALLQKVTAKTKLIFLCSPNNPTGNVISLESITKICAEGRNRFMVIVDEAYIEFSDHYSAASMLDDFDNLIVLRTLSKAYGLAGLRLGAVLANADIITHLDIVLPPFPLPTPVTELALMALQTNNPYVTEIISQRAWLYEKLLQLPVIRKVWPSEANFFLVQVADSQALITYLKQNRIIIRQISPHLCRITVGSAEQNQRCVKYLGAVKQ